MILPGLLKNPEFRISFSWASILTFATFWCYGFMAAVASSSLGARFVISIALLSVVLFFLNRQNDDRFRDTITLTLWDIFCFASYALLLLALCIDQLNFDLQGDQLFHAQYAHVHAIKALRQLGPHIPWLLDRKLSNLVSIFNISLLISALIACVLIRKQSSRIQAIAMGLAFLVMRGFLVSQGGNVDIHPALRLFPLWLSPTLFSMSTWALRLPQFLALLALMVATQKTCLKTRLSPSLAWLCGLAAGTLPVLWHVSLLVEPSIWSCTGLTLLFLALNSGSDGSDSASSIHWIRLGSILAVFTLMRQPTVAGYVPLILIAVPILFWRGRHSHHSGSSVLWTLSPMVAMAPSFLSALIRGTPATQAIGAGGTDGGLQQVISALQSGIALHSMQNSVMLPPLFLAAFCLIPRHRRDYSVLLLAVGFASLFFIFYSIEPTLWGMGRYQAEYVAPFVVVGLVRLIQIFRNATWLSAALLSGITVWNCMTFKSLDAINLPVDLRTTAPYSDIRVLSQLVYPYRQAMQAAKTDGFAGKLYLVGVGYGNFSEVLSGFTLGEYLSDFQIMTTLAEKKRWKGFSDVAHFFSDDITDEKRISLVLVSDYTKEPIDRFTRDLQKKGWTPWREFHDWEHGSSIVGMVRAQTP